MLDDLSCADKSAFHLCCVAMRVFDHDEAAKRARQMESQSLNQSSTKTTHTIEIKPHPQCTIYIESVFPRVLHLPCLSRAPYLLSRPKITRPRHKIGLGNTSRHLGTRWRTSFHKQITSPWLSFHLHQHGH